MAAVSIDNWDLKQTASVSTLSDGSSFTGLQKVQPVKVTWGNSSTNSGDGDCAFTQDIDSRSELVVTESDESTTRQYEIESFDDTNQVAWLWVYGSWNSDDSDQIVVGAGTGDGTDYSSSGTGANPWSQTSVNAEMVQHLNEDNYPTDSALDSTSNNNDGTVDGATSITADINGGMAFDGVDDDVTYGQTAKNDNTDFTVVSYVNSNAVDDQYWVAGTGNQQGWYMRISPASEGINSTGDPQFIVKADDGSTDQFFVSNLSNGVQTNEWYQFVMVADRDGNLEMYVDGANEGAQDMSAVGDIDNNNNFLIQGDKVQNGSEQNDSQWDGEMDELKTYTEVKSGDQILAEFDASPKGGQTFFSWSGEETTSQEPFDITNWDEKNIASVGTLSDSSSFTGLNKVQPIRISQEVQETDGFEDGDFTNDPTWTETINNQTATVQTTTVKNGSNAVEISSSDGNFNPHVLQHDRGANDSISDGDTYQAWIQVDSISNIGQFGLSNTSGDMLGNDGIEVRTDSSGAFNVITTDGTGSIIANESIGSYSANSWFKVEITFDVTNSIIIVEIFDSNWSSVGRKEFTYSGASNIQYAMMEHSDGSTGSAFFDDVSYSATSTDSDAGRRGLQTDDVEDGSPKLSYDDVDSNSNVYGTYSVVSSVSSGSSSVQRPEFIEPITSSGARIQASVKADSQQNNYVGINIRDGLTEILQIRFNDNGNVEEKFSSTEILSSWSSGIIYDITITPDFSNDQFDVDINGTTVTTIPFNNSTNQFTRLGLHNDNIDGSSTRSFYLDNYTYAEFDSSTFQRAVFSSSTWDNISATDDIVVTESDESTTRPYEIESLDTTSREAWLWVYGSWNSDDSDQIVVGAGTGDGTDYSVDGGYANPWSQTGVNAERVFHDPSDPFDSVSQSDVLTVTGVTSTSNGQFNGAGSFDGTDDNSGDSSGVLQYGDTDGTVISWFNTNTDDQGGVLFGTLFNDGYYARLSSKSDGVNDTGEQRFIWKVDDGNNDQFFLNNSQILSNIDYMAAMVMDNDGNLTGYIDGVSEGSGDMSSVGTMSGTDFRIGWTGDEPSDRSWDGIIDAVRAYTDLKSDNWMQAEYDASPKGGQTFFSWSGPESTTAQFNGATTTANADGSGETISLKSTKLGSTTANTIGTGQTTNISGTTTINTNNATASGTGNVLFLEPDFATVFASSAGTGNTLNVSGTTTLNTASGNVTGIGGTSKLQDTNLDTLSASGTGTGGQTKLTLILDSATAQATGNGDTIQTDRLTGFVDVENQPTAGVDVNVVDKTNNNLYETVTDSDGNWSVDSGDGVIYQVSYLFDDGSTFYGDAEQSDTT